MKKFNHTLTYARGALGIGCMRFKHGRHTVAYACIEHLHSFITTYADIGEHLLWPTDVDDSSLFIQI